MRFSPYDMTEYSLQTKTVRLSPMQDKNGSIAEGEWNLVWASIPEFDDFLNLRRNDFKEFNRLVRAFPYPRLLGARGIYRRYTELHGVLQKGSPQDASGVIVRASLYSPDIAAAIDLHTMQARLAMAQSLIDVKEASVICQNILTVDFKARRRA